MQNTLRALLGLLSWHSTNSHLPLGSAVAGTAATVQEEGNKIGTSAPGGEHGEDPKEQLHWRSIPETQISSVLGLLLSVPTQALPCCHRDFELSNLHNALRQIGCFSWIVSHSANKDFRDSPKSPRSQAANPLGGGKIRRCAGQRSLGQSMCDEQPGLGRAAALCSCSLVPGAQQNLNFCLALHSPPSTPQSCCARRAPDLSFLSALVRGRCINKAGKQGRWQPSLCLRRSDCCAEGWEAGGYNPNVCTSGHAIKKASALTQICCSSIP